MAGWGTIYNNTSFALRRQAGELARLQEQAASGARINRVSDAPSDAYRVMRLRAQIDSFQVYSKNLGEVSRVLELSNNVLIKASTRITSVKQLLTQVASGTYGPVARATVAEQIDAILEEVLSLANTKSLGRYILGGTSSSAAPFVARRSDGSITAVDYQGSQDELLVPVAPGVEYVGLLTGDSAFRQEDRQAPVFMGATGAMPGTATSTVRGDVHLTATHTLTSYSGGSGLAAGTSSAGGDTILGAHVLTIIVARGENTIRLDGGEPVTFQGTEQDLQVTGPAGEVVHVNLESWAGFEGDITITGTGKLTIDNSDSFTNLTSFTDNVAVTDSGTGRILYVDTTDVLRTGTEPVRVAGTHDLFGVLINARDLLANDRNLSTGKQLELLGHALTALDSVQQVVLTKGTSAGARLQAMDALKQSMETIENSAS
ncbi:hypothetical protein LCGC14_2275580, partial [marine sediment metagenome]